MHRRARRKLPARAIAVAALTLPPFSAPPAHAAENDWTSLTNGNWSNGANWSLGVPVAGQEVVLGHTPAVSGSPDLTVTADVSTPLLSGLTIDSQNVTRYMILNQTVSGVQIQADTETLGTTAPDNTYNQSAGTNIVNGLELAEGPYANNFYNLSGSATLSAGTVNVGVVGTATLTQSNTTTANASEIDLGELGGSTGVYVLSGGTLNVNGIEYIGQGGSGTFTQNAGSDLCLGNIYIAINSGSTGVYNLNGGLMSVGPSATVVIGQGLVGNGTLNVTGSANLSIGSGGGLDAVKTGSPSINLNGGSITTPALNFNGYPAALNWTTGALNISTSVTFDSAAAPTTTSAAFGSSLTLGNGQNLNINGTEGIGGAGAFSLTLNSGSTHFVTSLWVNSNGTLTVNNGSNLSYSNFTVAGGTVNGTLLNGSIVSTPTFSYQSGTFNGRLVNYGTVNYGSFFSLGNGLENDTTVAINAGQALYTNGAGLNNSGVLILAGGFLGGSGPQVNNSLLTGSGIIAGSGGFTNNLQISQSGGNLALTNTGTNSNNGNITLSANQFQLQGGVLTNNGTITLNASLITGSAGLTNAASGIITGNGLITAALTNIGTISPAGGTLTVPALTNNGTIEMAGAATELNGGPITNAATIEGFGKIGSAVTNNGVVQPINGTLVFGNTLTNPVSGLITAAGGTKVLVSNGLATNAGILNLNGGTFDNGSQAINNTGQITGYGVLTTGGLTNNGTMTLTGGTATVNGPLTNAVGKTIVAKNQPAIFTGPVTNNGTIKTTNTTVTFTGTYTGNAYISDPSTNIFQNNVTVLPGGSMTGSTGDQYIMSGGTFLNEGTYTNTGLLQSSDPTTNTGTFTQGGTQNWAPGTTFTNTSGLATFQSDAGSSSAYNLNVNITAGTVALQSPQHWAGVITSGPGVLDIENNHLLISYGGSPDPITSIVGYLVSGYAGGAWNGPGINSSTAAVNPGYGLGYADFADPGNPAALPSGVIEVAYTLLGDANLDRTVNGVDFGILAANFNKGVSRWDQGDFNYDNVVNGVDFGELAANFNKGASGAAVGPSALSDPALVAFAEANGLMADVPEPAETSLMMLGLASLGSRWRRRTSTTSAT
jgi:hypothetical protein